jgi:large subunit ribosomal protein L6
MSRIGKKPVVIPAGVTVTVDDSNTVKVTGPKGTLSESFHKVITIKVEGNEVICTRPNDEILSRSLHGTTRAKIHNMVVGVSEGFKKELEVRGVGYKVAMRGENLVMNLGYSHEIVVKPVAGIKISTPDQLHITVEGIDKQVVGQQASVIRGFRQPEPYLGKGIRYVGEYVPLKEAKAKKKGK